MHGVFGRQGSVRVVWDASLWEAVPDVPVELWIAVADRSGRLLGWDPVSSEPLVKDERGGIELHAGVHVQRSGRPVEHSLIVLGVDGRSEVTLGPFPIVHRKVRRGEFLSVEYVAAS